MKLKRTKKVTETVASVGSEVSEVTLSVSQGEASVKVFLSPKEARKLGRALRDSAIVVDASAGEHNDPF